ncbi:MAG: OPT/YSL family transporter [Candidatus Thorarchaeota archaeon]|nr:MAG: hypothetical protein DRP09_08280 [Candidatus Thorarchaeota archaeon]RLI59910.1 MAG: hypothetical protein DRO87_01445 [Candidatus Thorarchaeota archaeon]
MMKGNPIRAFVRRFIKNDTRALLAGLFIAGLFYSILILMEGHWFDAGVISTILIEVGLLYGALFRPFPDKKEMAALGSFAIAYAIATWMLGILSHVVVMAIGGIVLYTVMLTHPKYPMTKRAIGIGLIVGVIMTFMAIYLALKLGVVFLVGAEMLGAMLLSLGGRYSPQENTVVVAIANSSSMIAVGVLITFPAIAIFDPATAYGNPGLGIPPLITYQFIVFVTMASAIFGMLLLAPFRDKFEDEPWPQVQPQAQCINSIGGDSEARKGVGIGLGASALWMGVSQPVSNYFTGSPFSSVPNVLQGVIPAAAAVPDWIGINNSPMIMGIGFFVGWKRTLVIAAGSLVSFLVWLILEGANSAVLFGDHLKRPEILYLALGVFVTIIAGDVFWKKEGSEMALEEFEEKTNSRGEEKEGAIVVEEPHKTRELPQLMRVKEEYFSIETFKEEIRGIARNPRAYMKSKRGQLPPWIAFISMVLFMISGIIIFWFIKPFAGLEIHWLLFILGSPLALISAYFTARAISETGMLAGYISDIVAIPAVIFFKIGFPAITTFISMLGAVQDSAIALLVHLKLGRLTGVRGKDILKAVFIGAMLGTFIGSAITYMIFVTYGFGGTDFPSPAAQLFGFLVKSLEGLGEFKLPGLDQFEGVSPILSFAYLLCFAVVGFLAGRELHKRNLSPMSLVVGILIPPATSVAMLIGGAIDYKMRNKREQPATVVSEPSHEPIPTQSKIYDISYDRTSRILSGVVAGEAVVTVIWVIMDAILTAF